MGCVMLIIDKFSKKPIYLQLAENLEREIMSGMLKAWDRLPSVREISVSLCINPNTVQRALSELDAAGIIKSAPGRGSFVAEDARQRILARTSPQLEELSALTARLAAAGVSEQAIIDTVKAAISAAREGLE